MQNSLHQPGIMMRKDCEGFQGTMFSYFSVQLIVTCYCSYAIIFQTD